MGSPKAIVVCAGIHMSDIPSFPYALLWGERSVKSVANLTRADAAVFYRLNEQMRVQVNVENLFDTTYFPTSHGNNNILPGAPRSVRVSLRANF